jgi:hypothetical protein
VHVLLLSRLIGCDGCGAGMGGGAKKMGTISMAKSNDMNKQDSAGRVRKVIIVYSIRSVFYSQCILFTSNDTTYPR